jgi:hypothetical protein
VYKYFTSCPTCLEPIVDSERGGRVTVCDIEYHRECVVCAVCRVHLDVEAAHPGGLHVTPMKSSIENRNKRQMLLCEVHKNHVEVESTAQSVSDQQRAPSSQISWHAMMHEMTAHMCDDTAGMRLICCFCIQAANAAR